MKRKTSTYPTFTEFRNMLSVYESNTTPMLAHFKGEYALFRIAIIIFGDRLNTMTEFTYNELLHHPSIIRSLLDAVIEEWKFTGLRAKAFEQFYGITGPFRSVNEIANTYVKSPTTIRKYIQQVEESLANNVRYQDVLISETLPNLADSDYFTRPLDTVNRKEIAKQIIEDCELSLTVNDVDEFYEALGKIFSYGGTNARVTARMLYDNFSSNLIWNIRCNYGWTQKPPSEYKQIPAFRHNKRDWIRYIKAHKDEIAVDLHYAYGVTKDVPKSFVQTVANLFRRRCD